MESLEPKNKITKAKNLVNRLTAEWKEQKKESVN